MGNKKISEFTRIDTLRDDDIFLMNQLNSTCTTHLSTITDNAVTKITPSLNNYIPKPTGGVLGDSLVLDGTGTWVPKSKASIISETTINQGVVVAKGYFKLINVITETVVSVPTPLNVTLSRAAGSQFVTVNYSGLPSKYKSLTNPFFVNGQYIGINNISDRIKGGIYMIENHDPVACTFRIDTIGTTGAMSNNSAQLTVALNNVDNNVLDAYNIKSIYYDVNATSKYYVNFKEDLFTGSKTNTSPKQILSMMIVGQGYSRGQYLVTPCMLFDANRRTAADKEKFVYATNYAEGFGANSMGVHMGLFYETKNGSDLRVSNAIFACIV